MAKRPTPSARAGVNEMMALVDSAFVRALADSSRLEVFRVLLLNGPGNVGELSSQLPFDRSVVSRHLKVLEDAGIVSSQWQGRERRFSVDATNFVGTLEAIASNARRLMHLCCPPER